MPQVKNTALEKISQKIRDSLLWAGVRSAIKRHKNGGHIWKGRQK